MGNLLAKIVTLFQAIIREAGIYHVRTPRPLLPPPTSPDAERIHALEYQITLEEAKQNALKKVNKDLLGESHQVKTCLGLQTLSTRGDKATIQQLHLEHSQALVAWGAEGERLENDIENLRQGYDELSQIRARDRKDLDDAVDRIRERDLYIQTSDETISRLNATINTTLQRDISCDGKSTPDSLIISSFNKFRSYIATLVMAHLDISSASIPIRTDLDLKTYQGQEAFFSLWDISRGLNVAELQNRTRGEIFAGLNFYILSLNWFGVPQRIDKDEDDKEQEEDAIASVYQNLEMGLQIMEKGFNCLSGDHAAEFRDWRLRTMKCLAYAPKPNVPHGIQKLADELRGFFAPIPLLGSTTCEISKDQFDQLCSKAYEFVLLLREQKEGEYSFEFAPPGSIYKADWMDVVGSESRAKSDTGSVSLPVFFFARGDPNPAIAYTRTPALIRTTTIIDNNRKPQQRREVLVKAEVIIHVVREEAQATQIGLTLQPDEVVYDTIEVSVDPNLTVEQAKAAGKPLALMQSRRVVAGGVKPVLVNVERGSFGGSPPTGSISTQVPSALAGVGEFGRIGA